jgi:hypothetical protein
MHSLWGKGLTHTTLALYLTFEVLALLPLLTPLQRFFKTPASATLLRPLPLPRVMRSPL